MKRNREWVEWSHPEGRLTRPRQRQEIGIRLSGSNPDQGGGAKDHKTQQTLYSSGAPHPLLRGMVYVSPSTGIEPSSAATRPRGHPREETVRC